MECAMTQATRIPTLADVTDAIPRRFVVQVMYGPKDGEGTIAEVPLSETDFDTVVKDIADGQYEHVIQVYELRPAGREISRAVADRILSEGSRTSRDLRQFLQTWDIDLPGDPPEPEWEWEPERERLSESRGPKWGA
jgi:hypothetical protein